MKMRRTNPALAERDTTDFFDVPCLEIAAVTVSPIKTGTGGLCLASDGLRLLAEPCIKRPKNCTSLWNHNSANDGIDCVCPTQRFS